MKKFLNSSRKKQNKINLKNKIINSVIILLLGITLGILSKWLDNLSIDSNIWWTNIIDYLDLNNFFSDISIWLFFSVLISVNSSSPIRSGINTFLFLGGMCTSYHIYTILFSGFNPKSYMLFWYGITLLSPFLAYITWHAKDDNKLSVFLSSMIIFLMSSSCFSTGMWYFDFKGILYTLVFILSCITLYKNKTNLAISLVIGIFLSFIIRLPFISG